jgi:hypothetical protein
MPPEPRVSSLRDLADYIADNAHRIPVRHGGETLYLSELPAPEAMKFMALYVRRGALPTVADKEDPHAAA